jgi:hypothetical protein
MSDEAGHQINRFVTAPNNNLEEKNLRLQSIEQRMS